jgi:two-component system, chemotaxis family, protein-glutamate methylesterase/glutaminase
VFGGSRIAAKNYGIIRSGGNWRRIYVSKMSDVEMSEDPIRVLVVDDSAYLRKVLAEMLNRSPYIQVVGSASDGQDALEKVQLLRPDVVTLDLYMKGLDGVDFLRRQMKRRPVPVVVCSIASEEGEQAVAAMEAGAVEFVRKPTALALEQVYDIQSELVEKVMNAASVSLEKLQQLQQWDDEKSPTFAPAPARPRSGGSTVDLVAIGVSTGGPQALRYLLPLLPADFPVPIGIVLHMPIGYTGPLAEKLDEKCALEVLEAKEGLELRPGRVVIARAGSHMVVECAGEQAFVSLELSPNDTLHRPSVDVFFRSAAEAFGERVLGVVLTGMGNDGTAGAAWIKAQGGKIFSEDESTCIVYGMPRSVTDAGLSDRVIPLDRMANAILEAV